MKTILAIFTILFSFGCFATIPESITIASGNVKIRLDKAKRYNINRIEYKNQLLGVDYSHAHYGMTCRPKGFKFGVGSGHDESGFTEEFISLKITVDNKVVTPIKNVVMKGKKVVIEKESFILSIFVKYKITIENDILSEYLEAVSSKEMQVQHLYFFMHPWTTEFKKLYISYGNNSSKEVSFKSNNSFCNRKFAPLCAWYSPKLGLGVATKLAALSGHKKLARFIWDRPQYRKDYFCDYFNETLPANKKISYQAKTSFFYTKEANNWINEANKTFNILNK
jgi:hypothetical protein